MSSSSGIAQILPKLPLVFAGLFVLTMLGAILFALVRGISKSRIRLIILVGCLLLAFLFTVVFKAAATTAYPKLEETLKDAISSEEANEFFDLLSNSEVLKETLIGFVTAFFAPLVFFAVFLVLRIVTEVIFFIVMLFVGGGLKRKDKDRKFPMLRKLGLGVAQGLLIFFVLMTPLYAYLSISLPVVQAVLEQDAVQESAGESAEMQAVQKLAVNTQNNFFYSSYGIFGGKATCNFLTSFNSGGEKTSIAKEMNSISKMIAEASKLSGIKGTDDMTEETAEVVSNLMNNIGDSAMVRTLFGEVIYAVTDAWQNDRTMFGMAKPDMGVLMNPLLDVIIDDFHSDARIPENLSADFKTLGDMISVMAKANMFKSIAEGNGDADALIESLASGTLIKDLITTLGSNGTLKNLIPEFANIGMRALGESVLKLPANARAIYDTYISDITRAVNEVLASEQTDEAKIDKLAQKIIQASNAAGLEIDLDESIVKLYADAILSDVRAAGITYVSEDDIRDFFEIFASMSEEQTENQQTTAPLAVTVKGAEKKYKGTLYGNKTQEQLENSAVACLVSITVEITKASEQATDEDSFQEKVEQIKVQFSVTVDMSNLSKDSFTKDSLKTVSSIKEGDSFPTVRITVEDLLINTTKVSEMLNEDTIEAEAEKIGSIFNTAIKVKDAFASSSDFGMEKLSEIATDLGGILDSLDSTETFDGKTTLMITAIFQKDEVVQSMGMDVRTATKLAKAATESTDGGKVNFSATMVSVSNGAALANKVGTNETITEDDVEDLLRTMTPQTAAMLKVYLTEARVESYGIGEEKTPAAVRLLNALFDEMSKEYEDYASERAAMLKMFEVAKAASGNIGDSTQESLFNHGDVQGKLGLTAADTVALIMDSMMVRNAVEAAMYDENGEIDEEMKNPFGLTLTTLETSNDYDECETAIEPYYGKYPETRKFLKAVAALFGVEASFLD